MTEDIKEILFSEEKIIEKVKELGEIISRDYKGKDLIVVGVLKGSVLFAADLKDLDHSIEGKDILIVEDIVDSGITLSYLSKYLKARKANSIEIVTLLNKPARRTTDIHVKYIGFEVPDEFIVGYGIDYAEKYRNLPYIGVLKPEVYQK